MPRPLHPLRPKEGHILVCEGETDGQILQQLFDRHAPSIQVYHANSVNNLAALTAIMQPAKYVRDRDFDYSRSEAEATLTDTATETVWPSVDIEAYLLWADWLE